MKSRGPSSQKGGLYFSSLTNWHCLRDQGTLETLYRPRGRKPTPALEVENAEPRRRLAKAGAELDKARAVIEAQGNVFALLGRLLEPRGEVGPGKSTSKWSKRL